MYQSPYQRSYGQPYPNNYGMSTYAPNPYQTKQMMQPQPQAQPQTPYEIPIQDIRFVTSEEAKAYIVMPNTKALLIDRNGLAYLKTADSMGQSQTEYFRFEPVNADGSPIKPQEKPQEVDFSDFLKKSDLEQMGFVTNAQFETLLQKFENMQRQINSGGRTNGAKQSN